MASDPPAQPGTRKTIFQGVAASYLHAVVSGIATFVAVPVYLSLLGQELYGLFLAASSWVAYLALARVGFPQAAGNRVAEAQAVGDLARVASVLRTAVPVACGMALLAGGLVAGAIAAGWITPDFFRGSEETQRLAIPVLAVAATGFLLALPLEQFSAGLRGLQRVHLEQLVRAASHLLALGAGVAVLVAGYGVVGLAASQAVAHVLIGVGALAIVLRVLPRDAWRAGRADRVIARDLFGSGSHFLLLGLSGAMIWSLDNIVLSRFLGTAAVTPYAVSNRLLTLMLTWLAMGIGAVRPTLTAMWARGDQRGLQHLMLRMLRLAMAGASLLMVEFIWYGREFIRLWAGEEAVLAAPVFAILVASMGVRALTVTCEVIVVATSRHAAYAWVALAQGFVNLALSVWLVQELGAAGVALGTLLSYLTCTAWFVPWRASRLVELGVPGALRRVFVPLAIPVALAAGSAAGMTRLLGGEGWGAWVGGTGATALVFAASYAVLSLEADERQQLRSWLARARGRPGAPR